MKNIFKFLFLIFVVFNSRAQNTFPASGAVGIGTSPTAGPILDVNGATKLRGLMEMNTNTDFVYNAYYATTWKYRANGFAGGFYQDGSGNFALNLAPSGVYSKMPKWMAVFKITYQS